MLTMSAAFPCWYSSQASGQTFFSMFAFGCALHFQEPEFPIVQCSFAEWIYVCQAFAICWAWRVSTHANTKRKRMQGTFDSYQTRFAEQARMLILALTGFHYVHRAFFRDVTCTTMPSLTSCSVQFEPLIMSCRFVPKLHFAA